MHPSYADKRMAPAPRGAGACPSLCPTWSPELSRSVPRALIPERPASRQNISPRLPSSILGSSHSNERCWPADPGFRIGVR